MGDKNRYQRLFLMFNQEDSGFGAGQEPSGYTKIEVLDKKGKLAVFVQNLKEDPGRLDYKAYILKCDEKRVVPVCVGAVPLKKNKGELRWDFDPSNVAMTGENIEDFNLAVILAEYKDRNNISVICPLAAYKDKTLKWKEKLRQVLYTPQRRDLNNRVPEEPELPEEDLISQYQGGLESKYTPTRTEDDSAKPSNDGDIEHVDRAEKLEAPEAPEVPEVLEVPLDKTDEMCREEPLQEIPVSDMQEGHGTMNERKEETGEFSDQPGDPVKVEEREQVEDFLNKAIDADLAGNFESPKEYAQLLDKDLMQSVDEISQKMQGMNGYPGCAQLNTPLGVNANNPCLNCKLICDKRETGKNENGLTGMERLKKDLDQYFEIYTPFATRRRDYKWWKVGSPVYLNNILYQCDIKTPLLFNPKVMMAHFKYRYIIIGIYTDRVRRKEYIVCGVPGVYGVDDRAFGDACRWVQVEGNRPKYGAFGYWIVYIDPRTGKLLSAN